MSLSVAVAKKVGEFTVDATFESVGRLTALFGRSGAGKTTIVNLIAGLLRPDRGKITVDGETLVDTAARIDLPIYKRRIGYVFQEGRLFPHMSVRSNLGYGRRLAPANGRWASFETIVSLLDIDALLDRRPARLSGGEKQRVAIGRALLASPRLLLMDEPLASLDDARKAEIFPFIERLRDELKLPIVYVSHSVDEVMRLADTVVVLGDGQVVASGSVNDIFARPDLRPYTGQGEASTVLTAVILSNDPVAGVTVLRHRSGTLFHPLIDAPVGSEVRLRIRSRDVALARGEIGQLSIRNRLAATITALHPGAPPTVDVSLDAGGELLIATVTKEAVADLQLAPGMAVTALIKSVAFDRPAG